VLPELGEGAQGCGFGDLVAELGSELRGAEAALGGDEVVGRESERGDLASAAGDRGNLPSLVAAEGEDE
jgi:hypothetical protein